MKFEDAKHLVVFEWDKWVRTQPVRPSEATGRDSLKFFLELLDAQSPLLNFPSRRRDKWEIIHAWLLSEERVSH
jgi:hypothetical protein